MVSEEQPNNPLHGVKLVDILEFLRKKYSWKELGEKINIRAFTHEPTIKSSLKFLRTTPWARNEVEQLYLKTILGKKYKRPTEPFRPPPLTDEMKKAKAGKFGNALKNFKKKD